MDEFSINEFIRSFNEEGGTNVNRLYEDAVLFAFTQIWELPTQNVILGDFAFLVDTDKSLAVFQLVVRGGGM